MAGANLPAKSTLKHHQRFFDSLLSRPEVEQNSLTLQEHCQQLTENSTDKEFTTT